MQIQKIQSGTSFQANNTRYIDKESHEQLVQILRKMDKETVYKSNEYTFESTRTTRVELFNHDTNKKYAELVDTRRNLDKIPEGKDLFKQSLLTIGKINLVIDNKTGKITDFCKPFFTSWNKVFKQVRNTLVMINATYHNSWNVKKHQFSISGFTKKGFENLNKIKV